MSSIFGEIKRAIEEEMARQEGRPTTPRQRRSQDMSQYEDWLEQEQRRLRGPTREDELEADAPTEVEQWDRSERERKEATEHRQQQRQEKRSGAAEKQPQQRATQQTQYDRSEARHQRSSQRAYDQPQASELRAEILRSLSSEQGLRTAILLSEIIGPPVSLRPADERFNK